MKMYKRELEINGIVCDPLKAVHLVQVFLVFGISQKAICLVHLLVKFESKFH